MEQTLLLYALKSVLYAGVLTGYYWFGLRNQTFHPYNRFYLLGAMATSLLLPLVHWQWTAPAQALPRWYAIQTEGRGFPTLSDPDASGASALQNPWIWIGLLVLSISLFRLVQCFVGWMMIHRYSKRFPGVPMSDFIWHNTSLSDAPFSFFHRLFWREDIPMQSETGQRMLMHELTHIRERHSWDQLFVQLIMIVGWFNPFFWLIKQEMRVIHEFLADRKSVEQGDASTLASMLLAILPVSHAHTHHFSQSPIKRRIMMIAKPPQTKLGYWSRIAVFPTLGICFLALSASSEPSSAPQFMANRVPPMERILADTTVPNGSIAFQGEALKSVTIRPTEKDPKRMVHAITASGKDVWMSVDQAKAARILPPPPPPPPAPPAPSGGKLPPPPPPPARPAPHNDAENDLPSSNTNTIKITAQRMQGKTDANNQEVTMAGPINLEFPKDASLQPKSSPSLYVINGAIVSQNEVKQLPADQIALINVLKGKTATDKYGAAAESGVIEITTKQ